MTTRYAIPLLTAALLLAGPGLRAEEAKPKPAKVTDGTSNTIQVGARARRPAEGQRGGAARRSRSDASAGNGKQRARTPRQQEPQQ